MQIYGTILFIRFTWDQTSTELSNILDYQTVPTLASVLTGSFLLLLLYLRCTLKQRSIPFGYLLDLLVHGDQGPLL
jgi:hypothetical protein